MQPSFQLAGSASTRGWICELGSCGFLFQWKWSQLWMIWVIAMWLLCYLVCYMFPIDIQMPGEEVCMKGVLIAYPEHAVDTTHRNPKTLEPPKWRRWKRRSPRNPRRDFITFCQVGKIVWSEEICEHPRKGHVSYYVYIYIYIETQPTLGRYETKLLLYCKLHHICLNDTHTHIQYRTVH